MLNHISTNWEYRDFLTIHKFHLDVFQLKLLKSKYRPALSKLRKLDISLASFLFSYGQTRYRSRCFSSFFHLDESS